MSIATPEGILNVFSESIPNLYIGIIAFAEPELETFHHVEGAIRSAEEHEIDEFFLELSIHFGGGSVLLDRFVRKRDDERRNKAPIVRHSGSPGGPSIIPYIKASLSDKIVLLASKSLR